MPLNDLACRNAKPEATAYKMTDIDGLYLHIQPKGGKYWRYNYKFHGKNKTLAIGTYPEVTLAEA